jgi:hypothetical protein
MARNISSIKTYEDLQSYLRRMVAFERFDSLDMYDDVGVAELMLAIARNLEENANVQMLSDWANSALTDQDREFFFGLSQPS